MVYNEFMLSKNWLQWKLLQTVDVDQDEVDRNGTIVRTNKEVVGHSAAKKSLELD